MVEGVKGKIMSLFKTNANKNFYYSKPTRVSDVYGGRKKLRKKQSKEKTIRVIMNRIIRNIKNLSDQEEDYKLQTSKSRSFLQDQLYRI